MRLPGKDYGILCGPRGAELHTRPAEAGPGDVGAFASSSTIISSPVMCCGAIGDRRRAIQAKIACEEGDRSEAVSGASIRGQRARAHKAKLPRGDPSEEESPPKPPKPAPGVRCRCGAEDQSSLSWQIPHDDHGYQGIFSSVDKKTIVNENPLLAKIVCNFSIDVFSCKNS